jgi:hypothetical protein
MDNLVTVKLTNPDQLETRGFVIDTFKKKFLKKELSSVNPKGNITKGDKLNFPGYFISRMDLIQILSDISKDIILSDNTPFQDLLANVLRNPKVKDSDKNNIGIGVNFGYGFSKEVPKTTILPLIPISQELQLVIDVIGTVEDNQPSKMVSCYMTANLDPVNPPIGPPNGGTPYPNPII